MAVTRGQRDVVVGLIDGPVSFDHPELTNANIGEIPGISGRCTRTDSVACRHGTFVAGVLATPRSSPAPAICPGCTVLVRPIFAETVGEGELLPRATPQQLAAAISDCVRAGVWVVNLSAATGAPSTRVEWPLHEALDDAANHGVLVVAAAGNQGTLGSSAITRHPWVIPVVGYGSQGRPMALSNLGGSLGKRGLGAAAEDVRSIVPDGGSVTLTGTSFAAAIVTGTIALLWSVFSGASAVEIKNAVLASPTQRRRGIVPPLLNAWNAYQLLLKAQKEQAHESG